MAFRINHPPPLTLAVTPCNAEIGIPLTLPQLQREGLPRIVSRLVGRRHYLLAMRIAEALGVPTEQVRVCVLFARMHHWLSVG